MSEKKQNESKKSKNKEKNHNSPRTSNGDEDFHTAPELVSSDEEEKEEPLSSYNVDTTADDSESVNENADEQPSFRSSQSLHHLKTIKSVVSQHSPTKLSAQEFAVSIIEPPGPESQVGEQAKTKSTRSSISDYPKAVRISDATEADIYANATAGTSTDSTRKQSSSSKRNLRDDESFRTNLDPGTAFVYMVLPPDGGYGWVITFVSFLIQLITDGIVFSVGICLPFMAEDLQVDMTEAILISALQICFYYLSGPITSAIINRYGFRTVALIGASGASGCLFISTFSPNLETMLIFYSVLGGPCMAMVWVASQLIIGYYFEKYRSIANGLSCSGSGAGLITFVNLNGYLIPKIGWRNNTRIQAGLLIVALLLSLTYTEVQPSKIGIIREHDPANEISEDEEEREVHSFNYAEPKSVEPEDRAIEFITLKQVPARDIKVYPPKTPNRFQRCLNKFCCCPKRKSSEDEDRRTKRYVIKKDLIDRQDLYYTGPAEYTEHDRSTKREIIDGQNVELIEVDRPVQSINYSMSQFTTTKRSKDGADIAKAKGCFYYLNPLNLIPKKIQKAFRILFNFTLFRTMEFQVLFASSFLFGLAYNIPFLFSKARLNLPPELMSYIPIFIGVTNFSFRIICGFIAYRFKKSVVYLSGSAVTLGGLACVISAFYGSDNFWFQIGYASVFGIAPAFFSTLRAIIYVQYLGLENLTNAFGLASMGMGSAILFGTMIGGFLNQITGAYMAAFVFAGVCIMASGALMLLLPYFSRLHSQTERKVKFQI